MKCLNCGNEIIDSIYDNKLCNNCNELFNEHKNNPINSKKYEFEKELEKRKNNNYNEQLLYKNKFRTIAIFYYALAIVGGIVSGFFLTINGEFNLISCLVFMLVSAFIGFIFSGISDLLKVLKEIREILYKNNIKNIVK